MALVAYIAGCRGTLQNEARAYRYPPKYKIDGNFDDWKSYQTAQIANGFPWDKLVITPPYDGIMLKEFYYDSDDNYLYLFFKFKPTLQERYDKTHSSGALGYLYIDSDMDTNTGCTDFDTGGTSPIPGIVSGTSTIPGAEFQIYFPIGIYMNSAASGCYVAYEIKRWDSTAKSFAQTVRIADSREGGTLIAHGKDGVEVALLLTDFKLAKGSQISLAFWGNLFVPEEYVKRTTIQLK